ncbi:hypothetical protein [Desertibacillus haloalkaliphilus]|uniref:hypothetical protein n=1 Tax=Desertibacillus haloalkaliphilus TaxID=1328930 RepID=UPI001C256BB3|nr:hypothetical protein [Desertibacillus haloalkaliphilus]MBU8907283.1 hypothetical protein [Desertibacillus haloalkaliphilus]
MIQNTTVQQPMSTAEKFQQQKDWFALSSRYRPQEEKTIEEHFRQTQFPTALDHDQFR